MTAEGRKAELIIERADDWPLDAPAPEFAPRGVEGATHDSAGRL